MKGQFHASNLSTAARRAIHAAGMSTVGSYDAIGRYNPLGTVDDPDATNVVLRAYSPAGAKTVDVTAAEIYRHAYDLFAPKARVRNKLDITSYEDWRWNHVCTYKSWIGRWVEKFNLKQTPSDGNQVLWVINSIVDDLLVPLL